METDTDAVVGFPFDINWDITSHHRHTTFFRINWKTVYGFYRTDSSASSWLFNSGRYFLFCALDILLGSFSFPRARVRHRPWQVRGHTVVTGVFLL